MRRVRNAPGNLDARRTGERKYLPRFGAGQRPRHLAEADSADLRETSLRLEVSPPPHEPRSTGDRDQRGRDVRLVDDRKTARSYLETFAAQTGDVFRRPHRLENEQTGSSQRRRRRRNDSAERRGPPNFARPRTRLGRRAERNPGNDRVGSEIPSRSRRRR